MHDHNDMEDFYMDTILRPDERAGLALRELYHRRGYQPYRMRTSSPSPTPTAN